MLNTQFINVVAQRYGLPLEAVRELASELEKTRGQSVRFDIKALGGKGMWRLNQPASVGNGFNMDLNNVVTELCNEIATKIRQDVLVEDEPTLVSSHNKTSSALDDTVTLTTVSIKPNVWWPESYGDDPEKTGSVSGMRFAYFSQNRRLVLRQNLRNRIFDTENYNVQDVVSGTAPGFFNIVVQAIEGDLSLTDLREVAV